MFEINKKFTEEEVHEIETVILFKAIMGCSDAPPTTQAEFDVLCEKIVKKYHDNIQAEKEKEIKKANRKAENAKAMGLTIEKYEEYKKAERNYKRHLCEIRKAKEEIAKLEKSIKYHERKAIEWQEIMEMR